MPDGLFGPLENDLIRGNVILHTAVDWKISQIVTKNCVLPLTDGTRWPRGTFVPPGVLVPETVRSDLAVEPARVVPQGCLG